MALPEERPEFVDRVIEPSQGRVRAVRTRRGVVQYQDPDMVVERTYRDGTVRPLRNLFIARNQAVTRVRFDFERNRIVDSFGEVIGAQHMGIPSSGRVAERKVFDLVYRPLGVDPRRFDTGPNQEVIERLVLVDRNGNVYTRETSYGLGERYDRSERGGWFRRQASQALNLEEGQRVSTRELRRAVLHREFIVKTLRPR